MTIEDRPVAPQSWRRITAVMATVLRGPACARRVPEERAALRNIVYQGDQRHVGIDVRQVALLRRTGRRARLARWPSTPNRYSALATELKSDYPTLTPVEVKFLAWHFFHDAFGIRPGKWETRVELESATEEKDDGDVTAGGKRRRNLKPKGYRSVEWREEQYLLWI